VRSGCNALAAPIKKTCPCVPNSASVAQHGRQKTSPTGFFGGSFSGIERLSKGNTGFLAKEGMHLSEQVNGKQLKKNLAANNASGYLQPFKPNGVQVLRTTTLPIE
jgi:hypothetical protein